MNQEMILAEMENAIILLYQNKEKEGMDAVVQLLECFSQIAETVEGVQADKVKKFAFVVMKELIEAYQAGDVLAMADCLLEKGSVLVQAYFEIMGQ